MSKATTERRARNRRQRDRLQAGGMADLAAKLVGVGYWRVDAATRELLCSDVIYEIYGLPPEAGFPALERGLDSYHPDDRRMIAERVQRAFSFGEDFTVDARIVRPDGEVRQVVGEGACERDANGRITGVYGTLMDVTERRRANDELRRNEALYRLLAENATDIIGRIGLEGETLYVTPSATLIMGYSDQELIGRKTLEFVHRDDGARLVAGYRRCMEGGPPERIEYRFRHADGHWIWLEACPTLVRDAQGRPKEFIDVAREVTARKRMEADLVAARQDAEAAAEAKARFLANMSHELRTPITAVLGFTELLAARCDLDDEARRYVERIASGGRALLATVNDVLDFSKLEAGEVRIAADVLAPADLARETLELFEAQAAAKGLALELVGRRPLPAWAAGDPDRLRQVLLNLLGNAMKFTEAGAVILEADYDAASATASFGVTDTGPGIAAERMAQLFQRFSQVDGASTRRHDGTGLGLAICRGLVEAMGGQIGADSTPGEGSRFWFTVPMPAAEGPAAADDVAPAAPPPATRVLLADDNAVNRELVRAILAPFDVTLVEAADGHEAIAAAHAQAFDVILMDIRMPGCDGREAARVIRREALANRSTPIIAFSADGQQDALAGDDSLFSGRLGKPLKPEALLRIVADAVAPAEASAEDGRKLA